VGKLEIEMLTFRDKYAKNFYSQNGEDGILTELFKRLEIETGTACEFGASDGFWMSNIRNLIDQGWTGHQFDIQTTNPEVIKAAITPENVNEVIPAELDLLSIDIDGNDFKVWRAYKGAAKVVVIEINSDLPPYSKVYDKGTSYFPMVLLGIAKGYFLLCHTGNLIFVKNEFKSLFPEITGNPLTQFAEYFDYKWQR
jgi:hypothetical protein